MIPRFTGDTVCEQVDALPKGLVLLSPDQPGNWLRDIGAIRVARPVQVADLPLSRDPDTMRRAMHQKWRNRLRHAERQGLRVTTSAMSPDPNHWLLTADVIQAQARKYRGWPTALTLAWTQVAPGQTLYLEARDRKEPVAALLFLLHGTSATYHIGHTTDRGRASSAHNLLMWHAMQKLGRSGYQSIDLGRLHADTPGLNRFKLESGAVARELGGTWLYWRPMSRLLARPRKASLQSA